MTRDLVDVFYAPFVQPLGNLVVLFAQAEWALTDLLSECENIGEVAALEILKNPNARSLAPDLVARSGLTGFDLEEALKHVGQFWSDKDRRNRYIHDEWFVNVLEPEATAATRGIPRKKGSDVTWDHPEPEEVWALASTFREHRSVFSHGAYKLRKMREA